jgi:hypothetical protein
MPFSLVKALLKLLYVVLLCASFLDTISLIENIVKPVDFSDKLIWKSAQLRLELD